MRWLFLSVSLVLVCLALGEQYTDRYDDINIDEILENRRLLVPYVKCMLDTGRCTPEGKLIKEHVKGAMQSACEKCTQRQRQGARQVVKFIKENENEFWQLLKDKYDPEDKYKKTYEGFLARDD